jgi:hypothetical protein
VVDIPPEVVVVLDVWDLNHLGAHCGTAEAYGQSQLFEVDVEPVDAVEYAFDVIDDATYRRTASISW